MCIADTAAFLFIIFAGHVAVPGQQPRQQPHQPHRCGQRQGRTTLLGNECVSLTLLLFCSSCLQATLLSLGSSHANSRISRTDAGKGGAEEVAGTHTQQQMMQRRGLGATTAAEPEGAKTQEGGGG